ncbi:arf-GAP with Rho-GAP domain, ANK repeat and PH domain-containing protein 3 isoform X2 [Hippocampus zosterae]|uniref:arf-GAP with Rho-GAP domain, ANK repeat and PH domain-containing protein 3 isoform X2 n=1 Tax=Hippocampus zosterae TaxID=109293 RepID=UPI00223D0909|nr:arf-GAP with Rho-GAP domain, ANK repeat and PH domain-containing protein 3 isoform X2 [Hippocampus zosterae]
MALAVVVMATLDANTAVETLLAAIHLERYQSSFRRAGLLSAADAAHLDHEALVSLGITATGHRKRILRLLAHVQRRPAQSSATEPPSSLSPNSRRSQEFGNGSAPDPAAAPKPVPRPRTVFDRRRTAPVPFRPPPPDADPSPHRRLSQESVVFPPLERTGDGAAPVGGTDATSPPVPPRVARRAPPGASSSPPPPAPPRDERALAASRSPASPGRRDGGGGSGSGGVEMISNDIYWGTAACGPPTPPRQAARGKRRNSGGASGNMSSGSARDDPVDVDDVISPYCESLFQRGGVDASGSEIDASGRGETRRREGRYAEDHGRAASPDGDEDQTISPYASYASLGHGAAPIVSGWLDKLSPQGNYVFQKRFVKFDGKNLMYFGNEKDAYPKGVVPLAAIQMARPSKDNKFEIVTSQRIFVFKADNEVVRRRWVSALQDHVQDQLAFGRRWLGPGPQCLKHGFLELKGTKSKVYVAINGEQIWLYKSQQCFRTGIGMTAIEARGATIRDGKHKSFDLITPYRTFSLTADTEREKRDWTEALQEAIAETLSDYEVAEKIWSNRSNRACADCRAVNPDWASINLCVVICKNCAGQHRGLGTMVSKVQSLKLDTSVWSNQIVQLFIMLGNDRANEFWAARLSRSDELRCDASPSLRREFIDQKYREGRFRLDHPAFGSQEQLLKVLCSAVSEHTLLKTVTRIFSEARSLQPTAEPPDRYAASDPAVYDEIMRTVLHSGFLFRSSCSSRGTLSRRSREDFQRFWCSVDQSLLSCQSERSAEARVEISLKDVACLGVSRPESSDADGFADRFRYTFELHLTSDKVYQFGTETAEVLHTWTSAIGKAATPLSCHCLLTREFERIGRLRYRAMLDPQQWKEAYFVLQKSNLFICPQNDGAAEDIVNLKRLQELSVAWEESRNQEKKEILVLVEKGRTFHLRGVGRADLASWHSDIRRAGGGKGNALREQQLSRNDIPMLVDSCIAFITQYGLGHEGIYRKNGAKSRIKLLMEEFRKDARNVKLRTGDHFIEDVTDVLKRFFREIDDPVFMADLHPLWREAAKMQPKALRLDRYKELIRTLPRVNRMTLAALVSHLYSLFQTDGKGEHEVKIVEDLIDNYVYVFEIDEEHQNQMELEISLITSWKDTQLSQAGDLIIEVYLEAKTPDSCVTLKVSPSMCAEELTNQVLYMRNVPAGDKDVWMTFEAIEDGQLERPLHPKEKVLEQALQWCKMADPSSAHLLVKRVPKRDGLDILTSYKSDLTKVGVLRCREEPPKLLQGNKFQERSFQIKKNKLLLLKDKKSFRAEKEWSLKAMKVYMGLRRKLKAPTRWGFTVMSHKHQLFLCCPSEADVWDWVSSFLKAQNDKPGPPVLRRHSSSDIAKQKFGTMPLVPIRGDDSNHGMLSANQTLRKLHDRRTLSMYFPMKVQQDGGEERRQSPEPLYEEVGDFGLQVLKSLESSFLSGGGGGGPPSPAAPRRAAEAPPPSSSPAGCTPSQELLLQEMTSAFGRKARPEEGGGEEEVGGSTADK